MEVSVVVPSVRDLDVIARVRNTARLEPAGLDHLVEDLVVLGLLSDTFDTMEQRTA